LYLRSFASFVLGGLCKISRSSPWGKDHEISKILESELDINELSVNTEKK
tara:strand:- start:641 stop:790 length:150 start_codon:yes stop_codon:yes gene_type:complete